MNLKILKYLHASHQVADSCHIQTMTQELSFVWYLSSFINLWWYAEKRCSPVRGGWSRWPTRLPSLSSPSSSSSSSSKSFDYYDQRCLSTSMPVADSAGKLAGKVFIILIVVVLFTTVLVVIVIFWFFFCLKCLDLPKVAVVTASTEGIG